ncbi:hypothetical protein MKX01_002783, partial [Papaver californicum]
MRRDYGIDISYRKAYAVCKRVTEAVRGSPDASYQYLVGYSHMLELHNPGTITMIKTDANDAFYGFKTRCRPLFVGDCMYLTGPRKGILLSAIGYDANEQMYSIAFTIVDSENGDSCEWFMQKLFDAL